MPKYLLLSLTIHTQNLVKSYKGRTVVQQVSVTVQQGEIVGLLGPNGAGKTTTFYMVVGLIKPDEGSVFLNEQDITKLPMYKRAQMGIGYLPQEASVFRKLSVEDNILAVLEMTTLTKQERLHKLDSLLAEFNLHHVRKNNGDSLSGGERRRTEIARALAVDPKFILLDEPFAGVDATTESTIIEVLRKMVSKGKTIIVVHHDLQSVREYFDWLLLLNMHLVASGPTNTVFTDELLQKTYGGKLSLLSKIGDLVQRQEFPNREKM